MERRKEERMQREQEKEVERQEKRQRIERDKEERKRRALVKEASQAEKAKKSGRMKINSILAGDGEEERATWDEYGAQSVYDAPQRTLEKQDTIDQVLQDANSLTDMQRMYIEAFIDGNVNFILNNRPADLQFPLYEIIMHEESSDASTVTVIVFEMNLEESVWRKVKKRRRIA
jgi:hypothetical protein